MQSGKNFKTWGVSYGVVGDLIMGLPVLHYFKNRFPDCYKIWAIEKKVSFMAPLFLNHPLIDRIKITEKWNGLGVTDYALADACQYSTTLGHWFHDPVDWYNHRDCIEETARVAGIYDLYDLIAGEERYPKLERWFDLQEDLTDTYSKENNTVKKNMQLTIALWPFASAIGKIDRSPSVNWYESLIYDLTQCGYKVIQLGYKNDRSLMGAEWHMNLDFFEQVKLALSCNMSIGTDSGNMWVMGAYSHPAVHLMTNWMQRHTQNFDALLPVNRNGRKVFAEGGANNIDIDTVVEQTVIQMNKGVS